MSQFDFNAFTDFYRHFSDFKGGLLEQKLALFYHSEVVFADPVHEMSGLDCVSEYFASLSSGLLSCRFDMGEPVIDASRAFVNWQMVFAHRRLKGGQELSLPGVTELTFADGKIVYHRDYYDMGEMIYEHIPVLGSVVRRLKRRLAGDVRGPSGSVPIGDGQYGKA